MATGLGVRIIEGAKANGLYSIFSAENNGIPQKIRAAKELWNESQELAAIVSALTEAQELSESPILDRPRIEALYERALAVGKNLWNEQLLIRD